MESAYPNPFNSGVNFSVTSSKTGPVLISIFSLNGRLVTKFSSFVQKIQAELFIGRHQVIFLRGITLF